MFSFSLIPRPTETITGAEERSTVCADSRKGSPGWLRICEASSCGAKLSTSADAGGQRIRAKGAGLDRDEAWAIARMAIIGV